MRKLYLKIVIAIWAVMLISTATVLLVARTSIDSEMRQMRSEPPWEVMVQTAIDRELSGIDGGGVEGVITWMRDDPVFSRLFDIVLTDGDGNVVFSSTAKGGPPRPWRGAIGPARHPGPAPGMTMEFEHDDRLYRLTTTQRIGRYIKFRRAMGMLFFGREYTWLLLAIAIPLSAGLSFLIARYLTGPLRSFERAGQKLAEGDFSARIGPSLGNRADEIADFAGTFDRMAVRIEALVRSHKILLRDVSHELRSPLARAQAALSLARQSTGGTVDDELDAIEREIERLNGMIGKLLTFSRLDAKQLAVRNEQLDLDGLIADIVEESAIEAKAGGKCIDYRMREPCTFVGDVELLASSFENVIRNAVRHTPAGGSVIVSVACGDGECRVVVRDHGEGVAEDDLERIFDPFYRADDSRNAHSGGSGIGLAIARKAIDLHGGSILASNAPDGGLVLTIVLPTAGPGPADTSHLTVADLS